MNGRVFLYVQHLLGIGHLKRAAALANSMADVGLEVTLVSGGLPVPGIDLRNVHFVQLPAAAAADATFKTLVDENGVPVDDAWRARRAAALQEAWHASDPQAIVIELYPFGRRQMRFELVPLLDAVRTRAAPPIVVCSVRDILGGGQADPARQDEMLSAFERHFDRLLVHGDPAIIPFECTFRHTPALGSRLFYTGYVVDGAARRSAAGEFPDAGTDEVLVSAGGGAVGYRLLETAILARMQSRFAARTWRILSGANAGPAEFEKLCEMADRSGDGRVLVERSRHDFPRMLENCLVSVSQGGYNTILEIVRARARAVVVPFAGGREIEQSLRAGILAERGLVELQHEDDMTPVTLAAAIDRAGTAPRRPGSGIDLEGARRSAELVAGWIDERRT